MQLFQVQPRKPQKSAKQFLLKIAPVALALFDIPQSIYGFNVTNVIRKQIFAMSEESAAKKLDGLKELLQEW